MSLAMNEIQKTQAIRLYGDVLFIGPFLIYVALKDVDGLNTIERSLLGGIGALTIGYNLRNYIRQERALKSGS